MKLAFVIQFCLVSYIHADLSNLLINKFAPTSWECHSMRQTFVKVPRTDTSSTNGVDPIDSQVNRILATAWTGKNGNGESNSKGPEGSRVSVLAVKNKAENQIQKRSLFETKEVAARDRTREQGTGTNNVPRRKKRVFG